MKTSDEIIYLQTAADCLFVFFNYNLSYFRTKSSGKKLKNNNITKLEYILYYFVNNKKFNKIT